MPVTIRHTIRRYLIPGGCFVAFVVAVVWINASIDQVEYPFRVWRMDLDDAVANVAIIAGAVAGLWKVKLDADKAKAEAEKANRKAADLERKFNGGLADAARTHMQDNEVFESLIVRMDRFENERDDCQQALTELRSWMVNRLDQKGLGRTRDGRTN